MAVALFDYFIKCRKHLTPVFFSQGSVCLHVGHPQPCLHTPLLSLFLPRAAGNTSQLSRRLVALPVSHLPGHSRPLLVWLSGLPTHSSAGLSMLAAFLEHPFLEIGASHKRLKAFMRRKTLWGVLRFVGWRWIFIADLKRVQRFPFWILFVFQHQVFHSLTTGEHNIKKKVFLLD